MNCERCKRPKADCKAGTDSHLASECAEIALRFAEEELTRLREALSPFRRLADEVLDEYDAARRQDALNRISIADLRRARAAMPHDAAPVTETRPVLGPWEAVATLSDSNNWVRHFRGTKEVAITVSAGLWYVWNGDGARLYIQGAGHPVRAKRDADAAAARWYVIDDPVKLPPLSEREVREAGRTHFVGDDCPGGHRETTQNPETAPAHAPETSAPPSPPSSTDVGSWKVGDAVRKVGGDYRFDGIVRAAFTKGSGLPRYVVEDDRGVLHIYSDTNLATRFPSPPSVERDQLVVRLIEAAKESEAAYSKFSEHVDSCFNCNTSNNDFCETGEQLADEDSSTRERLHESIRALLAIDEREVKP